PYARFDEKQLILRDELALDRTVLANERTLLAYVRAALALLLAGVTFVHVSRALWFSVVGLACLLAGALLLAIGVRRYRRMWRTLIALRAKVGDATTLDAGENTPDT
ncbi:MAG TPA: DUF202 domain-containing protein, partial [Candidatus Hydrogenedentes bacterium]|nr:DUF202 domain-containing protein [Candidatus Hydrogenedentota bacterium]